MLELLRFGGTGKGSQGGLEKESMGGAEVLVPCGRVFEVPVSEGPGGKCEAIPPCPVTTVPDEQSHFPEGPFRYWEVALGSPPNLLFSRLNSPSFLSLSS
ncbi:hypothetical protein WISP_07512 [Willisornis vidua]|uniref:Uncharacterized protein n=1 Tax=Willisornis vidua TaxID=1566151 RepID=A0ABQ9DT42_9PASS|nr:hypothetical protein WISP_07512 [Willisornis vidua]